MEGFIEVAENAFTRKLSRRGLARGAAYISLGHANPMALVFDASYSIVLA
jgi:hypothetical protein